MYMYIPRVYIKIYCVSKYYTCVRLKSYLNSTCFGSFTQLCLNYNNILCYMACVRTYNMNILLLLRHHSNSHTTKTIEMSKL